MNMKKLWIAGLLAIVSAGCTPQRIEFSYLPVPEESGFRMDDYYVWCGSVIKVDSLYHMFAARWPKETGFPEAYRNHSEIVRATSSDPLGPYEFREVVIGERDSAYWDSNMAHNPTIHRIGDRYVLFYIGSDFTTLREGTTSLFRQVGCAVAERIEGPWTRGDEALIAEESNNPAVYVEPDLSVKMLYRDASLRVIMADAPAFDGPYTVGNDNVWPDCRLEDFYLFRTRQGYHIVCEDNVSGVSGHKRWGVHLFSPDGTGSWTTGDPVVVYDHDIVYDSGRVLRCARRERPQLLIEDGKITHLITAVWDKENAWSQPVALARPIPVR